MGRSYRNEEALFGKEQKKAVSHPSPPRWVAVSSEKVSLSRRVTFSTFISADKYRKWPWRGSPTRNTHTLKWPVWHHWRGTHGWQGVLAYVLPAANVIVIAATCLCLLLMITINIFISIIYASVSAPPTERLRGAVLVSIFSFLRYWKLCWTCTILDVCECVVVFFCNIFALPLIILSPKSKDNARKVSSK